MPVTYHSDESPGLDEDYVRVHSLDVTRTMLAAKAASLITSRLFCGNEGLLVWCKDEHQADAIRPLLMRAVEQRVAFVFGGCISDPSVV